MNSIISHRYLQTILSKKIKYFMFILFLYFLSVPAGVMADKSSFNERPRIGLVLSGGGARGAAHIGVIKVLEDMKIPIDCIAGTSMGAIIGGLYASGISPEEMEKIVSSIEWNEAFKDRPSPRELPFRRKQDAFDYLIDFDLGYRDGKFLMPKGLIQGQNLNMILRTLLQHTEGIHDFDALHIPFRAVAADIETGREVILLKGDLVKAIRASMSIPGVFAPVEIDGKMLVDGGIADNLPVEVARQMGADVLIVVDIGTPLKSRDQLDSAVGITAQVITIMIQRNTMEQLNTLRAGDILIQPALGDIATSDFARSLEAIHIGREKAASMSTQLEKLSVGEKSYQSYLSRQRRKSFEQPMIDYIRIVEDLPLSEKVLEAHVKTQPGEKLNMEKLKKDVSRLYGLDYFESTDFRLEKKDDKTGLVIESKHKSWGPNYLRFGLGVSDDFMGSSTYSVSTRFTQTALNRLGGEWRNELNVGENLRFFSEFYQPIDYSLSYFVAAGFEYRERNINAFHPSGDIRASYRVSTTQAGFDIGRQFGNWGEFRFGIRRAHGNVSVRIGNTGEGSNSFERGSFYSAFAYDTLDNYNFPLYGSSADIIWMANFKELGSDISAQGLSVRLMTAKTWDKNTIIPSISIQTAIDSDDTPIQDSYPLGGFLNMSGFAAGELSGRHTGVASLIGYRRLGSAGLGVFNMPVYLGCSVEAGNTWNKKADISFNSVIYAGSIFIGTNTYLGPVYLAYGYAEGGHRSIYFSLGQRF